jgi:photosystem II stability/assembly factor-like uncharacterized protein
MSQPSYSVAWLAVPTSKPVLFLTADGGRDWSSRRLPFRISKIEALNARTAVATTFLGRIRVTHDGGANWRTPRF